jgi:hypothetical protein
LGTLQYHVTIERAFEFSLGCLDENDESAGCGIADLLADN